MSNANKVQTEVGLLPEGWWRARDAAARLGNHFSERHMVGLVCADPCANGEQRSVITGFLLMFRGVLLWATAGHLISKLDELLKGESPTIRFHWLDDGGPEGTESIPLLDRSLSLFKFPEETRIDFGAMGLKGADARVLLANSSARPIAEEMWSGLDDLEPEGFYVVGHPDEAIECTLEALPGKKIRQTLRSAVKALPAERVDPSSLDIPGYADDPDLAYFRLLPFAGESSPEHINVKGMSGGPVFSIERTEDGELRYRLFGIQRAQRKIGMNEDPIILCEPMTRIAEGMIAELNSAGESLE